MDDRARVRASKYLSLVLRHAPNRIGLTLDRAGWANVEELLQALSGHGLHLTREQLDEIVATNDKRRFALSEDGARIRASQGHSIEVDLGLVALEPPAVLYHGTVERFLPSIRQQGLVAGTRQYVHLSVERDTATIVGARRGTPVILEVAALQLHQAGTSFFRSANGVWLTRHVPPAYLRGPGFEPA